MGRPRSELHTLLETMGANHVYFQPPNNLKMEYPCIVYQRYNTNTQFADNTPYHNTQGYTVTVIDRNPDSPIVNKIGALPLCTYNRFFTADNLNHDVYILYF